MLYYGIIYPTLTYGIEVYSNTSWTNLRSLTICIKKLLKFYLVYQNYGNKGIICNT